MGALKADFDWFKSMVYGHTAAYPPTRARLGEPPQERLAMGNFSLTRLPEASLREVWSYIVDLGFRPRMKGELGPATPTANGVLYELDVVNTGLKEGGLAAEDLTISLVVPNGATVVTATGEGYQGVRRDEQAKADVAVWTVPRMAAGDRRAYTLTLSQAGTSTNNVRGTIRWTKPTVTTGPSDAEVIAPAPLQAR